MIENIIKEYDLYIIIAEAVIIVVLLLWHFLFSNDDSNQIGLLEHDKESLKRRLSSTQKELNKYFDAFNQANAKLKQWNDWYAKNKHFIEKQEQKSTVIEFDISQEQKQQTSITHAQYQYLQEANDGKFMRLLSSPEKCYFRTWEEGGVRKYEFCGNVAKALANINAIFDDVCEIEGKRSGATDIENVSAGTLDSELRITRQAKIRLK